MRELTNASSDDPDVRAVHPLVLAFTLELVLPSHVADCPFCVAVSPLMRQLVFAANDTCEEDVDPLVNNLLDVYEHPA